MNLKPAVLTILVSICIPFLSISSLADVPPPVAPPSSQTQYVDDLPDWGDIDFTGFTDISIWVPPSSDFQDMLPPGKYWVLGGSPSPLTLSHLSNYNILDSGFVDPSDPCYEFAIYFYYSLIDSGYMNKDTGDISPNLGVITYVHWDKNNIDGSYLTCVCYDTSTGEPIIALLIYANVLYDWMYNPCFDGPPDECLYNLDIPFTMAVESRNYLPTIGAIPGFEVFSLLAGLSIITLSLDYKKKHKDLL